FRKVYARKRDRRAGERSHSWRSSHEPAEDPKGGGASRRSGCRPCRRKEKAARSQVVSQNSDHSLAPRKLAKPTATPRTLPQTGEASSLPRTGEASSLRALVLGPGPQNRG